MSVLNINPNGFFFFQDDFSKKKKKKLNFISFNNREKSRTSLNSRSALELEGISAEIRKKKSKKQ